VDVVDAIRARRAKRALQEKPVEDEKLEALVEAVRLSASCFNNQPWRIVICRGPEALEQVKGTLAKGNVWATRAPVIMVVAARPPDDCQLSDKRDYFLFSTGLAMGQLELRATELGLIAHPIAGYNPLKAKEMLGIPEDFVVITYVIEKASEAERPERKPVGENFYLDRWGAPFG